MYKLFGPPPPPLAPFQVERGELLMLPDEILTFA
jgi:hypothetical protein